MKENKFTAGQVARTTSYCPVLGKVCPLVVVLVAAQVDDGSFRAAFVPVWDEKMNPYPDGTQGILGHCLDADAFAVIPWLRWSGTLPVFDPSDSYRIENGNIERVPCPVTNKR